MRATLLPVVGLMFLLPVGARGQTDDGDRFFINVNAIHQCCAQNGGYSFWLSETLRAGSIDDAPTRAVHHRLGGAAARDLSGGVRVWRNLAFGAGVSTFHTQSAAEVVRLDRTGIGWPTAAGGVSGIEHRQVGYHFQAAWVTRLTDRFEVAVFGGPSRFRVHYRSVVDEFGIRIDSTRRPSTRTAVGGNFGFDFAYFVTERLGVGILVRITGKTIESPAGHDVELLRLGGSQVGIGARIRF